MMMNKKSRKQEKAVGWMERDREGGKAPGKGGFCANEIELERDVQAELAACRAFRDGEGRCTRRDIVCALNRVSSTVYLLMIQRKKEESHG